MRHMRQKRASPRCRCSFFGRAQRPHAYNLLLCLTSEQFPLENKTRHGCSTYPTAWLRYMQAKHRVQCCGTSATSSPVPSFSRALNFEHQIKSYVPVSSVPSWVSNVVHRSTRALRTRKSRCVLPHWWGGDVDGVQRQHGL